MADRARGVLDPARWFIVQADSLATGLFPAHQAADYPALVTVVDNVRAQARLLDA